MKVIFLDIDGVLNCKRWLQSLGSGPEEYPAANIDTAAVGVLNQIVRETGAKIVVSSTWRHHRYDGFPSIEACLQDTFVTYGFIGEVIGVTPDYFGLRRERNYKPYTRGDEIQAWLDQYAANCITTDDQIARYAVVDDELAAGVGHEAHFVQTTYADGLLIVHLPALRAVLGVV